MHNIQEKILNIAESKNLANITLRKIGELIGEKGSPQKIKHHLNQLFEKGLLMQSVDGKKIERVGRKIDQKSKLVSLPIYGSANCGQALCYADYRAEGFLQVSQAILGGNKLKRIKDFFVLKAIGDSMNKAGIEDGDYVIIDKNITGIKNGAIVLSIIGDMANIKKYYEDNKNKQIVLTSDSYQDYPPIYIKDTDNYILNGKVVDILKNPNSDKKWLETMQKTSAHDILKVLGPISKDEVEYYRNLPNI